MNIVQNSSQLLINIVLIGCVFFVNTIYPKAKHPYASDKPMLTPQKFEIPGVKSAWHITFEPDGKTFYFVTGDTMEVIYFSNFENGKWSKPKETAFSGKYPIETPRISLDGKKFFFAKAMVKDGQRGDYIYVMDKTESGWSEPKELDSIINFSNFNAYPSFAKNGNLYFVSLRTGKLQIFRSKFVNGKYTSPEALDYTLNMYNLSEPFISPDESYILFSSSSSNSYQLYISFNKKGSWSRPQILGLKVNSNGYQGRPCISPDGNYLFYTSADTDDGQMSQYQIDLKPIVDSLKYNIEVNAIIGKDKSIDSPVSIILNGKNAKVNFQKTPSWLHPYVKNTRKEQQVMNKIYIDGLKEGVYKTRVRLNSEVGTFKEYSYLVTLKVFEIRPALKVNNLHKGIRYEYYEDTAFTKIPDFTKIKPQKTGVTNKVDLTVRSRDTLYAINFNGYINIPKSAIYTFNISSDDGSKLYIDDKLYIDNDGLHGNIGKFEECCLEKGFHKIKVEYIQSKLGATLDLSYESKDAGIKGKVISNDDLYY